MLRTTTLAAANAAAASRSAVRHAAVRTVSVGSPRLFHHAAVALLSKQDKSAKSAATKQTGKPDLNVGVGASVPFHDPATATSGTHLEGEVADASHSTAELIGSKTTGAPKNPSGSRRVSTKGTGKVTKGEKDEAKHATTHPKGAAAKGGARPAGGPDFVEVGYVEVSFVEEKPVQPPTTVDGLKDRMEEGLASMTQELHDKKEQIKHSLEDKLHSAGQAIKETVQQTTESKDTGAASRAPMQPTADMAEVGQTLGVDAPQQNTSFYGSENRKMLPVTDMIKMDHDLIRLLYKEYTEAIDQDIKQRKVFALIHEMARHNACEELIVYPFLKSTDKIPGGAEIADRSQKEHDAVKLELKDVDRLASDIGSTDFVAALTRAIRGFEAHAGEEERSVLPLMDKHCTRSELFNLGEHFDNSATIVTGRPHPMAPDQGVPAIMAHLTSKPLDYLRDLFAGRSDVIDQEVAAAKKKLKTSGSKPASA